MDEVHEWSGRDAWLFVAMPRRSKPLRKLFFTADWINKDVPAYEELNRTLRLLVAAELVTRDGNRFAVSPQGRRLLRKTKARDLYAQIDRVQDALQASGTPTQLPDWELPRSEYETQLHHYHEDFERASTPILRRMAQRLWRRT